jgi:hypothetical protein
MQLTPFRERSETRTICAFETLYHYDVQDDTLEKIITLKSPIVAFDDYLGYYYFR